MNRISHRTAADPGETRPAAPAPTGAALKPGLRVGGRWVVERRIGAGGMATVYAARHLRIGGRVAIKVLHPFLSSMSEARERFAAEACKAARVNHPNVVRVHDAGTLDDDLPYLVMEYVEGPSLRDLAKNSGPLPWPRARRICLQLCEALSAVHDVGLVHRDVKPSNCICTTCADGMDFVKLLDFGIAADVNDQRDLDTPDGLILGTPDYLSPEQAQLGEIDHRSDIYSLGVVLYLLVTGQLPFLARRVEDQLSHHVHAQPRDPILLRPQLDPRVSALLLRALRKEPQRRFASARDLAEAVRALDRPGVTRSSVRAFASAAAVGLIAGGAIMGAASVDQPPPVPPVAAPICGGRAAAVPKRPTREPIARAFPPQRRVSHVRALPGPEPDARVAKTRADELP